MILFPAIDLQNGQCVRLARGDFNTATVYEADPIKQAHSFAQAGATWLHLVDLDGAQDETIKQLPLIEKIAAESRLNVQVGGGIRTRDHISALLHAGVERVIIGSLAIEDPALVKTWLKEFGGDKIVLAMDVRLDDNSAPEVLTKGWTAGSKQSLWDTLTTYKDAGLTTLICTDVGRDGMLEGPNHDLYKEIQIFWPTLDIIASGGMSQLQDLSQLANQGTSGAIIGKALYEGKIDLAKAIQICG